MRSKSIWIAVGLVVVLTTSGAVIHGRLSNRWGPPENMTQAGARLERIPSSIETWQLKSSDQLSETARSMLETAGDITRNYVDPASKAAVGVTIIVGPVGPISVHSPEICFPSHDFRLLENRKKVKIRDTSGVDHEFWMVDFQSQDLEARLLHVYYAWSTGGPWSAPESPRFTFSGNPYLYKIQLVGYASPTALQQSENPVPNFLRVFLPAASGEIVSAALIR